MYLRFSLIVIFILSCFSFSVVHAQITNSSLSGKVMDEAGKSLPGAIVEAIHMPTGTRYGSDTRNDGSFNVENMKVGGPYKVTVTFGGAVVRTYESIYLELGENYVLNVTAGKDTSTLSTV